MTGEEALRAILKAEKITQAEAAEICGYSAQGAFARLLNRKVSLEVFQRSVDALGYEVVVRKKGIAPEYRLGD